MLFNSLDFAIFLPVVFVLYWYVARSHLGWQNALVVAASYVFYGWWDWRFLSLILLSTAVDYLMGRWLWSESDERKRKLWLGASIAVNLGLLGFFKYFNFFVESFATAFTWLGYEIRPGALHIILPVGISFYTFQTLSYTIDVYRRKLRPTDDFIAFAAFVSFFPQLVAGPIERATHLLPQFYAKRSFDYPKAVDGLRQILWGLFKKMVIADNCAEYANLIFNNSAHYSGATLVLGAVLFAFQIYGDFSGYSDIAIGVSRLFGFDLMQNFAFPYFSRDIAEFWRRWHISLSTWFRDYLYIPLGGSRGGTWQKVRNTFIVFTVSGLWHGANWTFLAWGVLNALYFLPLLLADRNRAHMAAVAQGRVMPGIRDAGAMLFTFGLTVIAWIFFRAESIGHAILYIKAMAVGLISKASYVEALNMGYWKIGAWLPLLIGLFLFVEWVGRESQYAIERIGLGWPRPLRFGFYYLLMACALWFGGKEQQFIYFQF